MATLVVYSGTEDGLLQYDHATSWEDCKNGTGGTMTVSTSSTVLYAGQAGPDATGATWRHQQSFIRFDTSAINDAWDIRNAVFKGTLSALFNGGGDPYHAIAAYNWGSIVNAGDWRTSSQIAALTRVAEYNWQIIPSGYSAPYSVNYLNVNGGLRSVINKTGYTNLIIFDRRPYIDSVQVASDQYSAASIRSGDDTGTTNDPRLTVYSLPTTASYFAVYSEGDSNTLGYKANNNSFAWRAWGLLTGSADEPAWWTGAKAAKSATTGSFAGGNALDSTSLANRDGFYTTGSIYSVMLGTVDLLDSKTASQSYANIKEVWSSAKAKGFKVIAHTIPYMNSGVVTTAQQVDDVNNLIKMDRTLYDVLVDVNAAYTFGSLSTSTSDNLHMTQSIHASLGTIERDAWKQLHPDRFIINAAGFAGD